MQEFEEDVARHAWTHPHPQRKTRLRRKLVGRRARRVGLRGTRSNLLSVAEEEACNAFLAKVWNHPDSDQYVKNGRAVFTHTMRSESEQLTEKARSETFRAQGWVPRPRHVRQQSASGPPNQPQEVPKMVVLSPWKMGLGIWEIPSWP
eukprot:6474390-Amphidinium_carterae.1